MNWQSQIGKLLGDGRQLIHAFIRRKEWRMMREKNKSSTPSLTFPFASNINKAGNLVEKVDMR